MMTSTSDANLSLTINDLSIGDGLVDITCSGLLSSPDTSVNKNDHDHDLTTCSCHREENSCKISDDSYIAPATPSIEVIRAGGDGVGVEKTKQDQQNNEYIVQNGDHKDGNYNIDDVHSPTVPETREKEERGIISLFNETSTTLSRFLNRDHSFQDKISESTLGSSYRLSFADSTQFYSLAAGNLQDCLDEEDDDTAIEDNDNDDAPVVSMTGKSLISINTSQRNVTFRAKSVVDEENEHNEFLNSNGDVNAEKFHDQAMDIEENILKRDKMLKHLYEALKLTVNEKEEKELENQALLDQITELQTLLNKQIEDEAESKRENLSPTTETYSSHTELPNSEIEDLKLQVANLEKKLEVDRKYLEGQTMERELERDDFQRTITDLTVKIDDMKKDKERFDILISNQKTEIEDYEVRLRDLMDVQNEAMSRNDKIEDELKSAVEKIHELREIIRDLEEQIDGATRNVCELKDENQLLNEERARLESLKTKEDEMVQTTEEIGIGNADLTEELHAQVEDLTRRLERKLNDMDNFQWSTRPNSSCSNAVSVSNEDISVGRDLGYVNRDKDCVPHDIVTLLSDGLRKLDAQFESLVRFEEIIMKKLRDSEIRLGNTNKIQEELENEKHALHDKIKSQIIKISDLENRLDQFRFEPAPNAVTLSGLRARVTSLSNEVTECKGQLQLKEIEMQDLSNKLASKEALVSKLSMKPPLQKLPPPIKKYSVSIQTDKVQQPEPSKIITEGKKQSAFTQTTDMEKNIDSNSVFKIPKKSNNIGVQTTVSYPLESDLLDISRIPGVGPVPVTHSTPNDPVSLLKHSTRNLRNKVSSQEDKSSSKGNFAAPFDLDRSPEVMRDPSESRLNHSFVSDKIPRIPDLNDYEALPTPKVKPDSDYGSGIAGRFNQMKDVGERSVGTTAGGTMGSNPYTDKGSSTAGTGVDPTSSASNSGSGSEQTAINREGGGSPVTARRGVGIRRAGSGNEADDGLSPSHSEENVGPLGDQGGDGKNCFGMDKKLMAQVKCFLKELKSNSSIANNLSPEHYSLLQKVMEFLVNKVTECKSVMNKMGLSSDDDCSHSYEVVTVTDFAWDTAGQQLNVVKTQGKIVPVAGGSRCHIQGGGSVVRVEDSSVQAPAGGGGEMEDRGCDAESGPVGTSGVDWEMMEKSKQGRLTETASKVELATLRTQMSMMQQALNQEREKNCGLQGDLQRMSQNPAGSGDLCGRVEEYKYENDQQRMQISTLRNRVQMLESQNPGGQMGFDPMVRQQQMTRYGVAGGEKDTTVGKPHSQRWFELYLRAKSYRKALAWQKKYLSIVIQGYKDLLGNSGAAFEHPDLLQKQVPMTPSSVGLCDRRKGKTRFRIVGKAVLASIRMKYMVNRWKGKMCPKSAPDIHAVLPYSGSSRNASASSSSSSETDTYDNPRKIHSRKVKFVAMSPPTKENWSKKASRSAPQRTVKPLEFPSDKEMHHKYHNIANTQTETELPERQRISSSQGSDSKGYVELRGPAQCQSGNNNSRDPYGGLLVKSSQLSQYFERFHSLEKEIGNTLLRSAQTHSSLPNNSQKNEVKK